VSTETELKYTVPAAAAARLCRQRLVRFHARGPARRQHIADCYYDSAALGLLHGGLGLRVRHSAGRWWQTVKTAGPGSAGLHRRGEWECPLPAACPDPGRLPARIRAQVVAALAGAELLPIFFVRLRRSRWLLELGEQTRVELALDRGEIRVGDNVRPIAEVELELKAGALERLLASGAELAARLGLQAQDASKAEQGYRLAGLA